MDFTAIDFETANEHRHSACQLGAVVVRGGDIVRRHCWMIRPRPMRFSGKNIAVHGIRPEQVREEPDFGQLWESIREVIGGQVLVAHNARFDIGVLRACLDQYGLEIPEIQFTCTRAVSFYTWPSHSRHGLRNVADRLGLRFRHHDALEDAMCCAQVLLAAAEEHAVDSLESLERKLQLSRGRAGAWGCGGPRNVNASRRGAEFRRRFQWTDRGGDRPLVYQRRLRLRDAPGTGEAGRSPAVTPEQLEQWIRLAKARTPLTGQTVVVTGLLARMTRDEAELLIAAAGGRNGQSVTRDTAVLVVGAPDARTMRAGRPQSAKQERAERLRSDGVSIEVINEEEFFARFAILDRRETNDAM